MTGDSGVWVYAVARAIDDDWLEGFTGLDGRPVRTVAAAGLTAAVTTVRLAEFGEVALRRHLEDMAWLEAAARAHHKVIGNVAGHEPVVPMRLATVYQDDGGVAAMLAGRQADLAAALDRVTARAEWGVKVFPAETGSGTASRAGIGGTGAGGTRPPAGRPAPGAGAAYLSRRRQELSAAERARRACAASAEEIHGTLSQLAATAQLRNPQAPQLSGRNQQMILNGAYLVDDSRSQAFASAVRELAARHPGVRVELTGPWPPYSFAALPEEQVAV